MSNKREFNGADSVRSVINSLDIPKIQKNQDNTRITEIIDTNRIGTVGNETNRIDTNRYDTNTLDTNRLIEKADNFRY